MTPHRAASGPAGRRPPRPCHTGPGHWTRVCSATFAVGLVTIVGTACTLDPPTQPDGASVLETAPPSARGVPSAFDPAAVHVAVEDVVDRLLPGIEPHGSAAPLRRAFTALATRAAAGDVAGTAAALAEAREVLGRLGPDDERVRENGADLDVVHLVVASLAAMLGEGRGDRTNDG